jgi:hypothetical protein
MYLATDKAVEAPDRIGDGAVILPDQLAQILRVEPRRQRRRAAASSKRSASRG